MFQNSETINMVFILFNYINYKKSNKIQKLSNVTVIKTLDSFKPQLTQ